MVNALAKSFQEYFRLLPESISVYKSVSVKSEPVLKAVRNVSEQYTAVEAALNDSEASRDLKLLWVHIVDALEREMTQLQNFRKELDAVTDKISTQFEELEKSYFKNRADRLVDFEGALPPVCRLIEYAEDVKRFFDASHIHLSAALLNLSYSDQTSIDRWISAWHKSIEVPDYLTSIMAETNALISS